MKTGSRNNMQNIEQLQRLANLSQSPHQCNREKILFRIENVLGRVDCA